MNREGWAYIKAMACAVLAIPIIVLRAVLPESIGKRSEDWWLDD